MTAPAPEPTLASVVSQLDDLRDLFRRRLLDDRDKRALLHELSVRAEQAEQRRESALLAPLVRQLALVLDRMDAAADQDCTIASFVEEILDVLRLHGVSEVPSEGAVLPLAHEIAAVEPEAGHAGAPLVVLRILRRGFSLDGRVIRPALVVATPEKKASEPPASPGTPEETPDLTGGPSEPRGRR